MSANTVSDTVVGASCALPVLMSTQTHKTKSYKLINSPKALGLDSESSPSQSRAQALIHFVSSPNMFHSKPPSIQDSFVQTLHYQLGNCYLTQLLRSAMCPSRESAAGSLKRILSHRGQLPVHSEYKNTFKFNTLFYLFKICSNFINHCLLGETNEVRRVNIMLVWNRTSLQRTWEF